MPNNFGWRNVQGGPYGTEPVNVWVSKTRRETIRVASDSDAGVSWLERSVPIPGADDPYSGMLGYQRISPYFIDFSRGTIGRNAALKRQSIRATGDWEDGDIDETVALAVRYMKTHPGGD